MATERANDGEADRLVDVEGGDSAVAALPPLPQPSEAVFYQALGGVGFVGSIVIGFVVASHAMAHFAAGEPEWFWSLTQRTIYSLASCAIIAHAALLVSDPGVVERTSVTCKPMPPAVVERLRAGEPLDGLENQVLEGEPDATYCVRCCVWRRPAENPKSYGGLLQAACPDCDRGAARVCNALQLGRHESHHCRHCGRCVRDFDHHCGVLGRCIAGRGLLAGNMRFFMLLLACGQIAAVVSAIAFLHLIFSRFGWDGVKWLGWAFVAYMCMGCCVLSFAARGRRRQMAAASDVHI